MIAANVKLIANSSTFASEFIRSVYQARDVFDRQLATVLREIDRIEQAQQPGRRHHRKRLAELEAHAERLAGAIERCQALIEQNYHSQEKH